VAGQASPDPERDGDVNRASAGRAEQDLVLAVGEEVRPIGQQQRVAPQRRMEGEVELLEDRGDRRRGQFGRRREGFVLHGADIPNIRCVDGDSKSSSARNQEVAPVKAHREGTSDRTKKL
jgi:hypothetical protein